MHTFFLVDPVPPLQCIVCVGDDLGRLIQELNLLCLNAGNQKVEVASKFFIGFHGKNNEYIDDISLVAYKVLTSLSGFWFDLFTSVPWSYFDVLAYQASGASILNISCGFRPSSISQKSPE